MINYYSLRFIFLNFIVFPFALLSQDIGIGEWRDHLPYNNTISITADNNKIYCATPYSLFYYNKDDNSINRFTRVAGLSDIGISRIGYNQPNNTVLIAYSNTNIDLIDENQVINMPDIINSNAITPEEKTINNILFIENRAYLSCGFGIVVLNVANQEIVDTYYIGPNGSHLKVFDLTYNDTSFFAATEEGIYNAYIDNPNLAYFESWNRDTTLPFPAATYDYIANFSGKLFINKYTDEWSADTAIFYYDNNQWNYSDSIFSSGKVFGLKPFDNTLYIVQRYSVKGYDEDLNNTVYISNCNGVGLHPRDVIVENNEIWIADSRHGLVQTYNSYSGKFIYPNGPKTTDVYDITSEGNVVWSVAGGKDLSWLQLYKKSDASSFIDNEWNTINIINDDTYGTIFDLVSVAVNPFNHNQVFAGAWNDGLVEFNNNEVTNIYDNTNSSLEPMDTYGYYRIGGVAFDESGNLWVTNSSVANVLSVRQPD